MLTKSRAAALVLLLLWGISLACPTAKTTWTHDNVVSGWWILMLGFLGPLDGQFGWFANLTFMAGLVRLVSPSRKSSLDLAVATATIILCASALQWKRICTDGGCIGVLGYGAGYYLWFCAMLGVSGALIVRAYTTEHRMRIPAARLVASLSLTLLALCLFPPEQWFLSHRIAPFMVLGVLTCISIPLTINKRPLVWSAAALAVYTAAGFSAGDQFYGLLIALPSAAAFVAISKLRPLDRQVASEA